MLDEEMDGVAREQRERLESIEQELVEERKKLDRIWRFVESTDLDYADASDRIKQHRERREQLERAAGEAREVLQSAACSWTTPTPSPPSPRT